MLVPKYLRLLTARGEGRLERGIIRIAEPARWMKKRSTSISLSACIKPCADPSGIAFMYVRPDLIQKLTPTITGWFGQAQCRI